MPENKPDDLRQFLTASTETPELPAADEADLSALSEVALAPGAESQIDRDIMTVIDNLVTSWMDLNLDPTEEEVQRLINSLGASSESLRSLVETEVRVRIGVVKSVDEAPGMSDGTPV